MELHLKIDGEDFEVNRKNTTLFTFMGEAALYDHIFLAYRTEGPNIHGAYIFQTSQQALYEELEEYIVNNEYPQIINRNDAPNCDIQAWEKQNLKDYPPEDWHV